MSHFILLAYYYIELIPPKIGHGEAAPLVDRGIDAPEHQLLAFV